MLKNKLLLLFSLMKLMPLEGKDKINLEELMIKELILSINCLLKWMALEQWMISLSLLLPTENKCWIMHLQDLEGLIELLRFSCLIC